MGVVDGRGPPTAGLHHDQLLDGPAGPGRGAVRRGAPAVAGIPLPAADLGSTARAGFPRRGGRLPAAVRLAAEAGAIEELGVHPPLASTGAGPAGGGGG